jgi:hypothetical protein
MKLWHWAVIFAVLGIGYVLVTRPTVPVVVGQSPSTSNNILGLITTGLKFGTAIVGKVAAPSAAVPNGGTYDVNPSEVSGNTLVDSTTGETLTYGTD